VARVRAAQALDVHRLRVMGARSASCLGLSGWWLNRGVGGESSSNSSFWSLFLGAFGSFGFESSNTESRLARGVEGPGRKMSMIFGSEALEDLGQRRQRLVSRGALGLWLMVRLVFGLAESEALESRFC
jgi:hypothetical protein